METTVKTSNKTLFLLQGLVFSALGIIMILFPATLPAIMSIVIAVALFITAISAIWAYVQSRKKEAKNEWYLIVGSIVAVGLGIWLIIDSKLLLKLLAIAIGVWMLIRSIQIIGTAITMKSFGAIDWLWFILVGLVTGLFAIIFLTSPEAMGTGTMVLAGVALLLVGIYYFVLLFQKKTTNIIIKS